MMNRVLSVGLLDGLVDEQFSHDQVAGVSLGASLFSANLMLVRGAEAFLTAVASLFSVLSTEEALECTLSLYHGCVTLPGEGQGGLVP